MINCKDYHEIDLVNLKHSLGSQGYVEFKFSKEQTFFDSILLFKAYASMHKKVFCVIDNKIFFGNEDKEFIIEEVTNKKYSEYERLNSIECHVDMKEMVEEYQNKAENIISEEKIDIWKNVVPIRLNSEYKGKALDCALDILKTYNEGGDYKSKFKELDDENLCNMVKSLIIVFHDKGEEIIE